MDAPATQSNPLSEIVPDEIYERLDEHNLLNEKSVRNYRMRKRFQELRDEDVAAYDAIERIREEHAYLQFDTVRKIVYNLIG